MTAKRKPAPKKTGRPSTFSQAKADAICERLMDGESLRGICASDDMPAKITVLKWLDQFPEFAAQYTRAREVQADAIADEILHIADTPQVGEKRKRLPGGKVEVTTGDMIEHRKLQIDARKWWAGKLKPKKYGDRMEHVGTGSDGAIRVVFAGEDEKLL